VERSASSAAQVLGSDGQWKVPTFTWMTVRFCGKYHVAAKLVDWKRAVCST
jgi:hypothetical protein